MPSVGLEGGGGADKKWNISIIGYLKGVGIMATHVKNTLMNEIRKVFGEGNKINLTIVGTTLN